MMKDNERTSELILFALGIILVVWLSLLIAPYISGGLPMIAEYLPKALENPWDISLCENSLKAVFFFVFSYLLGIGIYVSSKRNYRRREEHGSAKWGEPKKINRKYRDKEEENNKLLTMQVGIGLNGRKHRRNLNVLVCGGSGAGKTRFYCKPNVREEDETYVSPLDELFDRLETVNPEHIALKYYQAYHSGSGKTLKSIQITLASRLEKFNLESLAGLTMTDELSLPELGEKKVALFALIPDNDTSFNFLVSILYTQLFQQLFYIADHKYGGSLPVHCHFLMDEFSNVSLPDDFDKILSVMRSRGVSVSIILQNLAQLKALFEKQWESIVGNCDEFLYLGGNEQSTHKYVSELLGKETIDTNTYGKSLGRKGNYSTNYQISGRELLMPDEVRMLDNRYALLFIRGERPVMDLKYDLLKHPNIKDTVDGGEKAYRHGEARSTVMDIYFQREIPEDAVKLTPVKTSYDLYSEESIAELME